VRGRGGVEGSSCVGEAWAAGERWGGGGEVGGVVVGEVFEAWLGGEGGR